MKGWVDGRRNARLVHLVHSEGKASALAHAFAAGGSSELVAIFDADSEPEPDALAWLAGAFDDPSVGGAGGYPRPGNADSSMVARYAALERWVCHLVTLAGKDRLDHNPAVLGAICALRRSALKDIGLIPPDVISEDIWISMKLTTAGWRTRWIGEAVAREDVASELGVFWKQRIRWSRGQLSSGRIAGSVEDFMVAAGYVDRLVFLAAAGLTITGFIPLWLPAIYLLAPTLTLMTALRRARAHNVAAYLFSAMVMLAADIGVTLNSAFAQLRGRRHDWKSSRPVISQDSEAA
jgi:cellulose synthase/poly-beta-1,6-N-acetylglucosamine synthase-like glycosyltransferase